MRATLRQSYVTMQTVAPAFSNLGSRNLFEILVREVFSADSSFSIDDVSDYCSSRLYRVTPFVAPTLEFLTWMQIINTDGRNYARVTQPDHIAALIQSDDFVVTLTELLFNRLKEDQLTSEVFAEGALTKDPASGEVYLVKARVATAWTGVVVLLRNLGVIHDGLPDTGLLRVDVRIVKLMIDLALTVRPSANKRKLSLEELKRRLAAQEAQGALAENFVVEYERRRLSNHPRLELIARISSEDASAGYDIVSFEAQHSLLHDRFIEVKSFKGEPRFYWSRSEYESARLLRKSYFIYLIDVNRIGDAGYTPAIFNDPITLEGTAWEMIPENWCVIPRLNYHARI